MMKGKDARQDQLMKEREKLKKKQSQKDTTNIVLLMESQKRCPIVWLSLLVSSVVEESTLMQAASNRELFQNSLVSILELTIQFLFVLFQVIPGSVSCQTLKLHGSATSRMKEVNMLMENMSSLLLNLRSKEKMIERNTKKLAV